MDIPSITCADTSNQPRVHAATSRTQSISYIQNIFQPVPKLYKYSADQLQVVVHRRSGEVENITPNEKHGCNGVQASSKRNMRSSSKESNCTSQSLPGETKTDVHFSNLADNGSVGGCNNVSTHSSISRESDGNGPDLCPNELLQPIEEMASPSKDSSSSECSSCEALLGLVGDADVQVSRLRELVDSKDIQLKESRQRLSELMTENNKLKSTVIEMKKGMNGLTKIVKTSNTNAELKDKRILKLLQRAWPEEPESNSHASLKDMDFKLEKMRDHVSRLSIVPYFSSKSPSPTLNSHSTSST